MIVAIDGPAGAGKSTTARQVAALLGFAYVDTGAMYRAVALAAMEQGIGPPEEREADIAALAARLPLHFAAGGTRLLLDKRDISVAIRSPEVSTLASRVAVLPAVRQVVVQRQRELATEAEAACGGAVLEGRDIQTVVFPDAAVKIFLTASPDVRALRRQAQWGSAGKAVELTVASRDILERDARDLSRQASPLVPAPDATHISTDDLGPEAVVGAIVELAREALAHGSARQQQEANTEQT